MWRFLKQLNQEGMTIILTTHYLEEAESMCRNIAILNDGEIVAQSSMRSLLQKAKHQVLIFECVESLSDNIKINNCECEVLDAHTLQITLPESTTISTVVTKLLLQNISVANIRSAQNRLENLFLSLTSKDD
jgi:ABC-2 type transport system ATP-binding protein